MPAFLQLATVCTMLSFESNAVLAVVVTHTPLHAFASQTGVIVVGVGVGLVLVFVLLFVLEVVPPSVFVHAMIMKLQKQIMKATIFFLIARNVLIVKVSQSNIIQTFRYSKYSA